MLKALHVRYDAESNRLLFGAENFTPSFCEDADFWRMHLDFCDNEKNRELGVYSHAQTPSSVTEENGSITIAYNEVLAEDGERYPIGLILRVCEVNGELDFVAEIQNNSALRVNELQYPVAEFRSLAGDFEKDTLYAPSGLGLRVANPLAYAQKAHTEYKSADYKNVWRFFRYPGEMSMPWLGIQSGGHYLAMSRCDAEACHITTLALGTGRREEKTPRLIMAICSYPAVVSGETLTFFHYRILLSDKDWRDAADAYRRWANETWLSSLVDDTGRLVTKESIRHMHGWQRIILKHQYGEVFHTYADLPRIYEEGAKYGIHMILLFGWWREGMDNGYPNYQPDNELGGAEGLREAIRQINQKGGQVVLYANGQLIDTATDYYKTEGWKYTKKNIEKSEYREAYYFANNGSLLKLSKLKTFCVGCFGSEGWKDQLIEIKDKHLALGSNGTFFDQFSCCFYLCFDESHDHGNRIDLDPQLRVEIIQRIRESLSDDEWFGSEWVLDRISPLLDFTHGCGPGMSFKDHAYPYLFRYAFPEVPVSNRLAHDEKSIYRRELNYAFVFGMLFDVSLYRGRIDSMDDCPDYSAQVARLVTLREEYCDFFTKGGFDLPSVTLPKGIWGAEYSLGERRILTIWNDTAEDFVLDGHPVVAPGEATVLTLA